VAKRVFISFAVEDSELRDFLVGQAKNEKSPFGFVDMSVKMAWDSAWKTRCRTKIKGCDGVIVIVTQKTMKAEGQLWEIKCAMEEKIPLRGLWGHSNNKPTRLPSELDSVQIDNWTWDNIKSWIDSL